MIRFFEARSATKLEVALIAIVLFCLPLFEAPKNAFSALFLIAWGVSAIRDRCLGRASPFGLPVAGLAIILWFAPLFSEFGVTNSPIQSAPRWTLLALFVLAASRLDYTRRQLVAILAALMAGGLVAVCESFWVWFYNGKQYPEFRSVGHVNHSSMYSLIPFAAGIGALYFRERWLQALGLAAILSTLAFLPPSNSLVGGMAVTAILMTGVAVWAVRRWSLFGLAISVCVSIIFMAVILGTPPAAGFRSELLMRVNGADIFSQRDKIFNSALVVWGHHPVLGTGWSSFGAATSEEKVRAALAEDGLGYDPVEYAHEAHGHNLWTTMLIERGLLGLGLVTLLLAMYFWTFLPLTVSRDTLDPSDRGISIIALLVAVGFSVAGLGNTTMINEHGHAGMALIAVCYGYLRKRGLVGQKI